MASVLASTQTIPRGSYVVARPVLTDAIGDILRASFSLRDEVGDEMKCLLLRIDRPTHIS